MNRYTLKVLQLLSVFLCFYCYCFCWVDIAVGLFVIYLKDNRMNRLTVKV